MVAVFVEVPIDGVVRVRKPVERHPLLPPRVAPAFGDDSGDECRVTDVHLEPFTLPRQSGRWFGNT